MTAKNDITGDSIKSKPNSDKYRESKFWDNVAKEKEAKKAAEKCGAARE
jgi:hypothetical protein